MTRPSRRLRWRVFLVAFLIYTVALVFQLRSPAEMKEIAQDKLSPRYQFLMFPTGEVPLYQSTQLDPDRVLGTLDRAVGVSHAEFVSGVVAANVPPGQMAYARVTELSLLPASDDPGLIERWQQAACPVSSTCTWSAERLDRQTSLVRLSIVDHKHARNDRFRYETDGQRPTRVFVAQRRTVFDFLESIAIYIGASVLTLIACIVVFRGTTGEPR